MWPNAHGSLPNTKTRWLPRRKDPGRLDVSCTGATFCHSNSLKGFSRCWFMKTGNQWNGSRHRPTQCCLQVCVRVGLKACNIRDESLCVPNCKLVVHEWFSASCTHWSAWSEETLRFRLWCTHHGNEAAGRPKNLCLFERTDSVRNACSSDKFVHIKATEGLCERSLRDFDDKEETVVRLQSQTLRIYLHQTCTHRPQREHDRIEDARPSPVLQAAQPKTEMSVPTAGKFRVYTRIQLLMGLAWHRSGLTVPSIDQSIDKLGANCQPINYSSDTHIHHEKKKADWIFLFFFFFFWEHTLATWGSFWIKAFMDENCFDEAEKTQYRCFRCDLVRGLAK